MKNTTGVGDTEDYVLGRGEIHIAKLHPTTLRPLAYRYVGNTPDFKFTMTSETLKHFASSAGLKTVDKEVTITQEVGYSFTFDEINDENLADWFSGETASHTNVAVAGFANYVMVPDGYLEVGRWYDIVNSSGNRAYDIDDSDLTVTTNEGTPVAMVLNTDYQVDEELGRIFVLSSSTVAATAIGLSKGMKVTLAAKAEAADVDEVRGLTKSQVIVALKFISINPATGDRKKEYQVHKTSLASDGDFTLIGDDWQNANFAGTAQANKLASPNSPTLTIREVVKAA